MRRCARLSVYRLYRHWLARRSRAGLVQSSRSVRSARTNGFRAVPATVSARVPPCGSRRSASGSLPHKIKTSGRRREFEERPGATSRHLGETATGPRTPRRVRTPRLAPNVGRCWIITRQCSLGVRSPRPPSRCQVADRQQLGHWIASLRAAPTLLRAPAFQVASPAGSRGNPRPSAVPRRLPRRLGLFDRRPTIGVTGSPDTVHTIARGSVRPRTRVPPLPLITRAVTSPRHRHRRTRALPT